ncbi:hypothetical protein GCM10027270_35300 [Nocardioides ginkgobilobae]
MSFLRRTCAVIRSAAETAGEWALWVWARVRHEPGYIDGLADLMICGIDLLTPGLQMRILAVQTVRVLAATIKGIVASMRHSPGDPSEPLLGLTSHAGFDW